MVFRDDNVCVAHHIIISRSHVHIHTLRHRNEIAELEPGVHTITTTPKFGIGQRCFLVPDGSGGNVLWDCVSFVDQETVAAVKALGYVHQ